MLYFLCNNKLYLLLGKSSRITKMFYRGTKLVRSACAFSYFLVFAGDEPEGEGRKLPVWEGEKYRSRSRWVKADLGMH